MQGRVFGFLIAGFIILIVLLSYLIFNFYFHSSRDFESINNSGKERLDQTSKKCKITNDDYRLPNFKAMEFYLSENEIIKKVPDKAKITLKFYHHTGNCRVWDKIYLLRAGTIKQKQIKNPDIEIWLPSIYAKKVLDKGLCETIKEARNKGHLGQSTNIGKTKLMWTYKSLYEHRKCFGL